MSAETLPLSKPRRSQTAATDTAVWQRRPLQLQRYARVTRRYELEFTI